jgi:hypothetical protein
MGYAGDLSGVEESEVPLCLGSRLLVLVEHGEDVGLDGAGALRRALPDMVDDVLVVGLRVPRCGGVAASRRPSALGHDDADIPGASVPERRRRCRRARRRGSGTRCRHPAGRFRAT